MNALSLVENSIEIIDGGGGVNVIAGTGGSNTIDLTGMQVSHINRIEGGYFGIEMSEKCQSAAV